MPTPRAAALLPLALLALLAPASRAQPPAAAKHHHHHRAPKPAEVRLSSALTAGPGIAVAMPPIGLSLEYPTMARQLGTEACPPPALVAELLRLGAPPLQLGGASQDATAPSGALTGAPSSWETASLYQLPAPFWSQLHCLLGATHEPLTAGLNMRTGSLAWASAMVAGAQSAATSGLSFSLANEPDLYGLPNYASLAKPAADAEAASASLYEQLSAYLAPALGGAPVIGPELARPAHWRSQLAGVIAQQRPQLVGVHLYPLSGCASPRAVTIPGLLSASAGGAPSRLRWVVAAARAAGLQAIISEANSASCGGRAGVSDTPAAAVWASRFVLAALENGFREVRFHFAGDPYDPFVVRGQAVTDQPIESALYALSRWLPVGSTVRPVAGVHGLTATAIGQPGGAGVLVLDNASPRTRQVVLRGAAAVQLETLSPARSGLHATRASATGGAVKLALATNTVVAVSGWG